MPRPLSEFSTLTFDCYGTLIDWESGIWERCSRFSCETATPISPVLGPSKSSRLPRACRSRPPRGSRIPDLLTQVHSDLAEHLQLVTDPEMDHHFGESVPFWPAFPDSSAALQDLGTRYRLVVLSNVDRAGFAASENRLEASFDVVYTAEDIGSYKPDPRNFSYLLDHLASDFGVGPEEVLHVAQSLYHDHVPAQSVGLATAWIDRQRLSEGGDWGATAQRRASPGRRLQVLLDGGARQGGAIGQFANLNTIRILLGRSRHLI